MSEEQKQALIADCKEDIESIRWRMDRTVANMGSTAYLESCLKRQQIALASLTAPAADHVSVQEAWEACGGNPGIKATREELLEVLKLMDETEDEAEAGTPAVDLFELVPGDDLVRVLSFAKFVIKCVRKNGEYAPLSSQEPDEISTILRKIEAGRILSSGAEWFREQYLLKITPP